MRSLVRTGVVLGILWTCLLQGAADEIVRAERLVEAEQWAEATAVLKKVLRSEPANVQALDRLAYVHFRLRELPASQRLFEQVVKLAPPAWYARYFLGRIRLMQADAAGAIHWLEPVVASGEVVHDAASRLAGAYLKAGQPGKAAGALEVAIAQAPADASLYFRLGNLRKQTGRAEAAREAFATSTRLRQAGNADKALLGDVSRLLRTGNSEGALAACSELQNRANADAAVLVALGLLFANAGVGRTAEELFGRAAAIDPRLFAAQLNYGLAVLKRGATAEAIVSLGRATELAPLSAEANLALGLAYVIQQKYQEAIAPLTQALRADPDRAKAKSLLATAYLRTKEPKKAVAVLRTKAGGVPDDLPSCLLLIDALLAAEDEAGALAVGRSAQARFPDAPQTHMAVGQAMVRAGKYAEGRVAFESALRLAKTWPEAQLGLAECLLKEGNAREAVEHFRPLLDFTATELPARVGLARSLWANKDFEGMRAVLEGGLPAHGNDLSLRQELARAYARLGRAEDAAEQTRIAGELRAQASAR